MIMTTIMRKCVLALLLTTATVTAAWTQDDESVVKSEYAHRRYSVSDGLPENYCWNVYQDSKGYIWVGTYNGFTRYDGQSFKNYWQEKETNVQNVTENREGNITALSYSYYAVLDPEADTLRLIYHDGWRLSYYNSQNLPPGYFFYESTGTEKQHKALCLLSDTGLVKVWENEYLSKLPDLYMPYWDRANGKFYIPAGETLYVVNEAGVLQDSIEAPLVYSVFIHKNTIWGLGRSGIYKYEHGNLKLVCSQMLINNPSGVSAIEDREGRMIIRDAENIYLFDGVTLKLMFSNIALFNVILDLENNLWVSTYDGLFNLFGLQFRNYTFTRKDDIARSLLYDRENDNLWIGSFQGYLYQIKDGILTEKSIPRRSGYSYLQGFPGQSGRHLYFPGGYDDGNILHYDGKKGVWLNIPSRTYNFVLSLPDENHVLFGGWQGVIIYNQSNGKIVREIKSNELNLSPADAILDAKGRILVAGSTGIAVIDDDSIRLMEECPDDFLACRNLATDNAGKIWAASNTKLYSLNDDSIKYEYTFAEPIRGIYVTRNNVFIVLTMTGVQMKRAGDANFVCYDRNNGFTGEKMQRSKMVEDSNGNIWLLADKSLICFNPNELLLRPAVPNLHIRQAKISKDNIRWTNVVAQENHRFGYRHKNIKFEYVGLCYSAAGNVRYSYRLLGFQDGWSEPSKSRELTFNNLPPGNYIFEIFADSGTGESQSGVQSFAFTILPAFWQTWWFSTACIALLMLITGFILYKYMDRQNIKKIAAIERQKQLNSLQIQSIRLRSIPHFNANVLAGIEYYIMNFSKEEANRYLSMYSSFTNITLNDVDRPARTLEQEIQYVELYLNLEKMRFGDSFLFTVEIDAQVDKSILLPNMILHTHCENAIKHGLRPKKDKGLIQLSAISLNGGDELLVTIEDNGVGREESERIHTHGTRQGLNILTQQIGLYNQMNNKKIIQRIIDLHDANNRATGTRIEIIVPKGFNYN
jgi:ligand-binding sensor domain-containing protein